MKQKYEKPITKDLSHVLTVMGAGPDACWTGSSATGDPVDPGRPKNCALGKTASGDRCTDGLGPSPLICNVGRVASSGKEACSAGTGH